MSKAIYSLLVYPFLLHRVLGEIMLWVVEKKRNYYFTLKLNVCMMKSQWSHSKNRNKKKRGRLIRDVPKKNKGKLIKTGGNIYIIPFILINKR